MDAFIASKIKTLFILHNQVDGPSILYSWFVFYENTNGHALHGCVRIANYTYSPWLSNEEFLKKYQMIGTGSGTLLGKTELHLIFYLSIKMSSIIFTNLIFLHCVGTKGDRALNNNQRTIFAIGYGTVAIYW